MEIRIFLPSDSLVQIARQTLVIVAYIAAITAVLVAGAGLLYILIWFCSILVTFIRAFASVCQTTFNAIHGNYVAVVVTFVTWALFVVCMKLTCALLPSIISFFGMREARA